MSCGAALGQRRITAGTVTRRPGGEGDGTEALGGVGTDGRVGAAAESASHLVDSLQLAEAAGLVVDVAGVEISLYGELEAISRHVDAGEAQEAGGRDVFVQHGREEYFLDAALAAQVFRCE